MLKVCALRVYRSYLEVHRVYKGPKTRVYRGVKRGMGTTSYITIWVVVEIMVPFRIPIIIRHLIFRVPKEGS